MKFKSFNHLKFYCYKNNIVYNDLGRLLHVNNEVIEKDKVEFPIDFEYFPHEYKTYNFPYFANIFKMNDLFITLERQENYVYFNLFKEENNEIKNLKFLHINTNNLNKYFDCNYDYLNNTIKFMIKKEFKSYDNSIESFEISNNKIKINNKIVNLNTFILFFKEVIPKILDYNFTTDKLKSFEIIKKNEIGIPKFYNLSEDIIYIDNKKINKKINKKKIIYDKDIDFDYYYNDKKNIIYFHCAVTDKIIPININPENFEKIKEYIHKIFFNSNIIITTKHSYLIKYSISKKKFKTLNLETLDFKNFDIIDSEDFYNEFISFKRKVKDDEDFQSLIKLNYLNYKILKKGVD